MSSYQTGIPTGFVDLDTDYANIQGNFQQLDTTFGIDHTTFSNQTAQNGYHTNIHLIPNSSTATNPPNNQPVVAPANTPGYGQVFSAQINDGVATDEALYFLTGGNRLLQLTRNFVPVAATNGYTFLPGGLILQWGVVSPPGSSGTVTFATANIAFPTNLFSVQLSLQRNSGNQSVTIDSTQPFSKTTFSYLCSSGGSTNLYWTAIGN